MSDPIFPDGIRVYHPKEGAPDFVKGALVITPNVFEQWLHDHPADVLRLDIKQSRKGPLYLQLNTYQRKHSEPVKDCPQPETAWKPPAGAGNPAQQTDGFEDSDIPF